MVGDKSRARAEGGGGVGGVQIGVTSDHHGNVAITQHFQGHGKVAFNETVHLIEALPLLFLTYSGSGEFYLYGVCDSGVYGNDEMFAISGRP